VRAKTKKKGQDYLLSYMRLEPVR